MRFTFRKVTHTACLWTLYRLASYLCNNYILKLNISLADFAPDKRGLLPHPTARDLQLRAMISVYWIWSSYAVLICGHNLLAILFVALLGWDLPAEWPPIFGNVLEAYSLCRFWSVFWHRLHLALFTAYTPPLFLHQDYIRHGTLMKAVRAFWVFLLSAIIHAAVHWVTRRKICLLREAQFFFSNYALCLCETMARRVLRRKVATAGTGNRWTRLLGYMWVYTVNFALVPAWQYPWLYGE